MKSEAKKASATPKKRRLAIATRSGTCVRPCGWKAPKLGVTEPLAFQPANEMAPKRARTPQLA